MTASDEDRTIDASAKSVAPSGELKGATPRSTGKVDDPVCFSLMFLGYLPDAVPASRLSFTSGADKPTRRLLWSRSADITSWSHDRYSGVTEVTHLRDHAHAH